MLYSSIFFCILYITLVSEKDKVLHATPKDSCINATKKFPLTILQPQILIPPSGKQASAVQEVR